MPLDIIIAGAGVAGLTASMALLAKGHKVTVYERRDDDDRGVSSAGIQLQPNALRVLQQYDLLDAVSQVGQNNRCADMRDYQTGETLALIDFDRRGGTRYPTRTQMKQVLIQEAVKRGVVLHKGVGVDSIEQHSKPVARLNNGTQVSADLIIGADGTWSKVRQSLYPSHKPHVLPVVVFQVQLPEDDLWANPETAEMDRNGPASTMWCAPNRMTFTARCTSAKLFDMQLVDVDLALDKDPNPDIRLGWVTEMDALRKRFSDHADGFKQLLDKAERHYKWRLVEVSGLPSWSNDNGNVVLIGDSCHATRPFAGQGSAMGIEDAAVIAEVLDNATSGDDLKARLQLFEKLRRPRCEIIQKYAANLGRRWAATDKSVIAGVRHGMTKANDPAYPKSKPDKTAAFNSPAFEKWLDLYDAAAEVRGAKTRAHL